MKVKILILGVVAMLLSMASFAQVDSIVAFFTTPAKTYCNKSNIGFHNQTEVFPLNIHYAARTRVTCEWDWGDGAKDTQKIICGDIITPVLSHRYNLPNTSTKVAVTLRAWIDDEPSYESIFIDTFTIIGPIANFTDNGHIFPCQSANGRVIQFTDSSDAAVSLCYYRWHFGDNYCPTGDNIIQGKNATVYHLYTTAGIYDVTLIVEDDMGCFDTIRKTNHVFIDEQGPTGTFTYEPLSGCVPFSVTFTPHIDKDNMGNFTADTITWLPDGISSFPISGSHINNPYIHTYETAGAYIPLMLLIKWIDNNGKMERCPLIKLGIDTIWICDDVGAKQLQGTSYKLQVYPNPTSGQLQVTSYELQENSVVEIYSVAGQLLYQINKSTNNQINNEISIDISHLASGMYFLKIDNKVVKFVKE